MSDHSYDYVVIGGGSAGYNAASLAVRLGLKTAVIEGGKEVGGLCILRGCMPSKTLLQSAHRAESIRRAEEFGLRAEYHGADPGRIRERKRALIGEFADYRRKQLEGGKFDFHRGQASFLDANTVEVRGLKGVATRVESRAFLVATGSYIKWPPIPGLREVGVLTSDDVLDSDQLPKSVIVLGGGPTALEFATYYRGLGSQVTVIQRSAQLLRGEDLDVAEALRKGLEARGIRVLLDTKLLELEKHGDKKRVHFEHLGVECMEEAEAIVYALGRGPFTDGLELDRAGVTLRSDCSICVDERQRTTANNIFAAGDVCGPYEVVHIAIQQAELATRNAVRLLQGEPEAMQPIDYSLKLFAVFTEPQVGIAGLTLREAHEQKLDVIEASYPFNDHGKSMVMGETDGFVKLIAERSSRRILGGAVVGPEASELIHEIVVAMAFDATAGQLARVPHYHPTLSEIWTYPAEELAED